MFAKFMQTISNRLQCLIIYPEYKFSPEYPFPAGLDECYEVVKHVLDNPSLYGDNINIMGDSAGGNFSAVIAKRIAYENEARSFCKTETTLLTLPKIIGLIYPLLQVTEMSKPQDHILGKSYKILFPKLVLWYYGVNVITRDWKNMVKKLLNNGKTGQEMNFRENNNNPETRLSVDEDKSDLIQFMMNPEVSPLLQSDEDYKKIAESGLKFHIQCAEHDQLWVEAEQYANRLKQFNPTCVVKYKRYDGCMHGWYMMGSSKGGSLPRNRWTKQYDDLIDEWLDEMDNLMN